MQLQIGSFGALDARTHSSVTWIARCHIPDTNDKRIRRENLNGEGPGSEHRARPESGHHFPSNSLLSGARSCEATLSCAKSKQTTTPRSNRNISTPRLSSRSVSAGSFSHVMLTTNHRSGTVSECRLGPGGGGEARNLPPPN